MIIVSTLFGISKMLYSRIEWGEVHSPVPIYCIYCENSAGSFFKVGVLFWRNVGWHLFIPNWFESWPAPRSCSSSCNAEPPE
jgi:hypothetical protein